MPIYVTRDKEARELLKAGFKPVLKFRTQAGSYYQFEDTKELKEFLNK